MATITAGRDRSTPTAFVKLPRMESCPSWCVGEHDADVEGNLFHRSPVVLAAVPEESAEPTLRDEAEVPMLTAHLVVPEGPEFADEDAQITVDCGDLWGPYAELSVDQADRFIRDLKTFTARVQQLRDQLAEQNGVQS
ncbi:hypothetical protein [Streptomyces sp. NPDC049744]|uniref:DUF6907 domain-containing protein n=1 Tax=Streptomyces sp. NPDC049744 TaxID=3154359 RepID=UPI00341891F4